MGAVLAIALWAVAVIIIARRLKPRSPSLLPPGTHYSRPATLTHPSARTTEEIHAAPPSAPTYKRITHLLTRTEQLFYEALQQAVSIDQWIVAKVRLCDIIATHKQWDPKAFNRINQKHIDFLICNREDSRILCAIELDDWTHAKRARRDRDSFLNTALQECGITLLRIPVTPHYDSAQLAAAIQEAIE